MKDSQLYEECYRFKEQRANVNFFLVLLLVVALFLGFRGYWVNTFGGVQVDGSSMYNTLLDEEQLIMRYTPNGRGAKRGDVIVVYVGDYPEIQKDNEGLPESRQLKYLIKRLIAVEGDTLYCKDGQIYLKKAGEADFQPMDDPYAFYLSPTQRKDYDFAAYTVGKGEIFFLGDNRARSKDSRYQEEGGSHLDRLYKQTDIVGVVPTWAITYQNVLEKIFF